MLAYSDGFYSAVHFELRVSNFVHESRTWRNDSRSLDSASCLLGIDMSAPGMKMDCYCRGSVLIGAVLACFVFLSGACGAEVESVYARRVWDCLTILMGDGTDRYGRSNAPILVSILDVETRQCPSNPAALDEAWRAVRRERRNPAGANLLTDLPMLKTMYSLSKIASEEKFAHFADRYVGWYLQHLVDERGFIWWGWHRHFDVFADKRAGHLGNHHEIHAIHDIPWAQLWNVNSNAVLREIEAIWRWHVIDKETGEVDRHGDGVRGCDFAMSAGSCAEAFAFLHRQTGERVWLDRVRLLSDRYWNSRNPATGLFPDRPNAGANRFDGSHFLTSDTGLFCHSLFKCTELTGDARFQDQAVTYLKAYGRYGFDAQTGKFWGSLNLDGTPVRGPRVPPPAGQDQELQAEEYGIYEPRGHLDLWQPYVAGYEHPIATAQMFAFAALRTGDSELRVTAERFARWIGRELPPRQCETNTWYRGYSQQYAPRGTYAGIYGQTISFFIQMFLLTGDAHYLNTAQQVAEDATERLEYRGLFRGHPAKPYYEALDGVGCLLYSLLQLDRVLVDRERALVLKSIPLHRDDAATLALDNW